MQRRRLTHARSGGRRKGSRRCVPGVLSSQSSIFSEMCEAKQTKNTDKQANKQAPFFRDSMLLIEAFYSQDPLLICA